MTNRGVGFKIGRLHGFLDMFSFKVNYCAFHGISW